MIYRASFVNPMDGEYDSLDSSKIDQIELLKNSIRSFDGDTREYFISYEFLNKELEKKVILLAMNVDLNATFEFVLDMQRFVDEVSRAAHNKKLPDSTDYIQELKHRAASLLANRLLEDNKLSLNAPYNHFGFIYSGIDKIGTFETMTIENKDVISFNNLFSIVDISNVDNLSFETYFNGTLFNGTLVYKESEMNQSLKNPKHIFELSNFNSSTQEASPLPTVEPYESYATNEDFIEARRSLISLDVQNESFSIDEFSDLF